MANIAFMFWFTEQNVNAEWKNETGIQTYTSTYMIYRRN